MDIKVGDDFLTFEDIQDLIKIIGQDEFLRARTDSLKNMTRETLEIQGTLLGASVTIRVEFDATANTLP